MIGLRPRFLALLAALSSSAWGAPTARGYVQVPQSVAPHVHLLHLPTSYFLDPTCNVEIIEQSDGLIVVDGGDSYGAGERVVAMVRSISPKPVKAIVLTHYHSDHSFGMSALLKAWPKADFIASRGTYQAMFEGRPPGAPRERSQSYEEQKIARMKRSFATNEKQFADVKTAQERAGWKREFATLGQRVADFPGTYTILPKHVFDGRLDLADPITPVQLLFLGRANTPGDTLVWLPRQRILATGDVVVAPAPYMFDVYPAEMVTVFDRIRALRPKILIPGHGGVQKAGYAARIAGLVRQVREKVAPMVREGKTLEQIQSTMDATDLRRQFSGNNPWLGFWFDNYTWGPLVESAFHEAHGDPLGPPPVDPPPG